MITYSDSVSGETFLDTTPSVVSQSRSVSVQHWHQRYRRFRWSSNQTLGEQQDVQNYRCIQNDALVMGFDGRCVMMDAFSTTNIHLAG
jgi:hypothetical protein